LLIFLKAAGAIIQEFPKTARSNIKGFLKAIGNFMKKYTKNGQPQQLSETL
jgi:hypothetical protein